MTARISSPNGPGGSTNNLDSSTCCRHIPNDIVTKFTHTQHPTRNPANHTNTLSLAFQETKPLKWYKGSTLDGRPSLPATPLTD